jgi:tripartite-type tricarboxylate transporter receptor subunit TctC
MKRFGLALLLGFSCSLAAAQGYPSRPIRLFVTYPPGGGADIMARLLAPKVGQSVGQPVLVENKAGASGQIAADTVAKSAPDGYTLMLDAANFAVNPSLYAKLPYDPEQAFAPVTLLVLFPNMLVVNPHQPFTSVQALIQAAKAKPGSLSFASSGNGSAQHLAGELFRQQAAVELVHVPYKGGGPALTDVMAGQVPMYFANMASGLPYVKAGRLRALGITGSKRTPAAPELPTIAESGLPGFEVYEWNAIFAPGSTPPDIVRRLHAEFAKALAQKDVQERIASLGGEISGASPQDTRAFIAQQTVKWAKVVREARIKVD